jgi:hypothetical protein
MNLGFSKVLAIIIGTALPLLAIVRSWTAGGDAASFFADLLAGAFLLVGAWRVSISPHSGQRFLAAAWGLTMGLFYSSLYMQALAFWKPVTDEIPLEFSIAVTGFGLLIAILGLIACLKSTRKS